MIIILYINNIYINIIKKIKIFNSNVKFKK